MTLSMTLVDLGTPVHVDLYVYPNRQFLLTLATRLAVFAVVLLIARLRQLNSLIHTAIHSLPL